MIEVVVSLSMATICFLGQCHPALVGQETPTGVFPLQKAKISAPGYGGTVILYAKNRKGSLFAIHRPWLGRPQERRLERLYGIRAADRQGITGGCINISDAAYDALWACETCTSVSIVP